MQDYRYIVIPGFINENHWCLVIANMNTHMITTYDSKPGNREIKLEYMAQFEYVFLRNFTIILICLNRKLLRGIAARIAHPMPAEAFEKRQLKGANQRNSIDCGVHTCVNLLALKKFKPLKEVGHRCFMPYFRRLFVMKVITHFNPNLLGINAQEELWF